jgi:hypothetical protein
MQRQVGSHSEGFQEGVDEQNTLSGRSSFWAMTRSEGKFALKLSTIMAKEVYDQLLFMVAKPIKGI